MSQTGISADRGFLPARRTWERYGVTSMTLHRWLRDPAMGFPQPVYIGRFRYFRFADLEQWERDRTAEKRPGVAGTTAPKAEAEAA